MPRARSSDLARPFTSRSIAVVTHTTSSGSIEQGVLFGFSISHVRAHPAREAELQSVRGDPLESCPQLAHIGGRMQDAINQRRQRFERLPLLFQVCIAVVDATNTTNYV